MFHFNVLVVSWKGKTNTQSPSPAERLPSLDRSSRAFLHQPFITSTSKKKETEINQQRAAVHTGCDKVGIADHGSSRLDMCRCCSIRLFLIYHDDSQVQYLICTYLASVNLPKKCMSEHNLQNSPLNWPVIWPRYPPQLILPASGRC